MLKNDQNIKMLSDAGRIHEFNLDLIQVMEILLGLRDADNIQEVDIYDEMYLKHLKRGFHSDFQRIYMDQMLKPIDQKRQLKSLKDMKTLAHLLNYYLTQIVLPFEEIHYIDVKYILKVSLLLYVTKESDQ